MIRNFLREYFCFSRGEKNGTLVLCSIMLLVLLLPHFYGSFVKSSSYPADPDFLAEIDAFYRSGENGQDEVATTGTDRHDSRAVNQENAIIQLNDSSLVLTELNSADTIELMQIRGIGPVLSRRILKYRGILGGYVLPDQLKEVYGVDEERFLEIRPFLTADTSRIVRLRPANDDFRILLRHPYLDYNQVSQIFKLRDSGELHSVKDLLRLPGFTDADLKRLSPYLIFDSEYSGQ